MRIRVVKHHPGGEWQFDPPVTVERAQPWLDSYRSNRWWDGISTEEFGKRATAMAEAITEQRAKGWTEFHPEAYCHRCGGKNVRSWFVASDRFNVAVEALGLTVTAIICPGCFVEGHEQATGLQASWELVPATPFRPIERTT